MVVRKILESTLVAGTTTVTFTDTEIPNSLLRVYCTKSGLFPISQTLSGNSVIVSYKPQDSNVGVALEIVKSGLDIVDDLESEDATKALSANQGYVLKGLIDGIVIPTVPENITDLDDVDVTDIANGQVLAWNSETEKFENVNQSGGGGITWGTPSIDTDAPLKTVGSELAIDFNGFVCIFISPTTSSGEVYYTVEKKDTSYKYATCWRQSGYYSTITIPVLQGDTLKVIHMLNVSRVEVSKYPFE